jgi:transcriptional regulator with XRE-family HTH domain
LEVREVEAQLLEEVKRVMREKGMTQTEFADRKGISRQSVNPYFSGKRGLLTDTGKDLLEFLGVEVRLVRKGGNDG